MSFHCDNIDYAIVHTQYDLRGFADPLGFRIAPLESAKCLDAITGNLLAMSALGKVGHVVGGAPTDELYVCYRDQPSFEQCLEMCRKLHHDCDNAQREAIQLIVQEIVHQNRTMQTLATDGEIPVSSYLQPLKKGNRWGNLVLALVETFGEPVSSGVIVLIDEDRTYFGTIIDRDRASMVLTF